jgi:hypothetical protein
LYLYIYTSIYLSSQGHYNCICRDDVHEGRAVF